MDRKTKFRVLGKLLDAGYCDEKAVVNFGLKDMQKADIRSEEVGVVLKLQEAARNHKVILFFADEKKKEKETSGTFNGGGMHYER